jgi:hypothetical protein
MDLCDEMRYLRINPTKEGYAFIATVAVRGGKTYLISRTLDTMKQEGFSPEVSRLEEKRREEGNPRFF